MLFSVLFNLCLRLNKGPVRSLFDKLPFDGTCELQALYEGYSPTSQSFGRSLQNNYSMGCYCNFREIPRRCQTLPLDISAYAPVSSRCDLKMCVRRGSLDRKTHSSASAGSRVLWISVMAKEVAERIFCKSIDVKDKG